MNDQRQFVHRLERGGLRVQQSFAWQMDGQNVCPHHQAEGCGCQMAIYLVYGADSRPATLLVHTDGGRTRVRLDQSVGQRVSADFQNKIFTALYAA